MQVELFLVFSFAALAFAKNVQVLTSDNFDSLVGKSRPAMVKFFAPWCGHCKTLSPIYQKLSTGFPQSKVLIAEVNTDEQKDLAKRFGIRGLPTIYWFEAGSTENPEKYNGGRDVASLSQFINSKTGLQGTAKEADGADVVSLNSSNFDRVVSNPSKNVLVKFFAPWCGHCIKLKPIYEQLAEIFKNDSTCVIAEVNGDQNKDIIKQVGIRGYPTLYMYPAGSGNKVEINGRNLKDLVAQVNRFCNTMRTVKGILSKSAGLVPDMEPIVKQFVKNPVDMQKDTIKMFETQEKSTQSNGEYKVYAHVMKLIVNNGPGVVEKEIKRLTNLINGEGIDAKKADEFTIRRNVLAVFADALGVNVGDLDNDDVVETPDNVDAEEVSEEIKEF